MVAYGLLRGKQGGVADGLELLRGAVEETPHINEFRVIYIAALIDQAMFDEARKQLENLKARDRYGVSADETRSLGEKIPNQ